MGTGKFNAEGRAFGVLQKKVKFRGTFRENLQENSGKFSGQISLHNDQRKWLILCEFSGHISLESNQFCTALTDFLKWYHDKNHIFPVEAMLKYKQVFCMSKKNAGYHFQISFFIPEVFKFLKYAN